MALPRLTDEIVLEAVVSIAGDGYCLLSDLLHSLPKSGHAGGLGHADRRRAVHRSVNRGLVLERRGPNGRAYVALTSEGWRRLRDAA